MMVHQKTNKWIIQWISPKFSLKAQMTKPNYHTGNTLWKTWFSVESSNIGKGRIKENRTTSRKEIGSVIVAMSAPLKDVKKKSRLRTDHHEENPFMCSLWIDIDLIVYNQASKLLCENYHLEEQLASSQSRPEQKNQLHRKITTIESCYVNRFLQAWLCHPFPL